MGKLLDPLADKLTQIAVVLSLAIRHKEVIPLLVICVLKELAQAAGEYFFCAGVNRYGEPNGMERFPPLCFTA